MYGQQPKKMMILCILEIMKKYTDEQHRLSQKEVMDLLEKEYEMQVDRKSVKANLEDLMEFDSHINCSTMIRKDKNGNENTVCYDWYYCHDFSGAELLLMTDSLLFSQHISSKQKKEMIGKLENLSSKNFHNRLKGLASNLERHSPNKQLFYSIEILNEAIESHKQVEFEYLSFTTEKELKPRKRPDGTVRTYTINPYRIVMARGHYYLICNYDKYAYISDYRIDRIKDIRLLDSPAKDIRKVKGCEQGFDLSEYMANHIYMFSGELVHATLRAKKYILNDIADYFGSSAEFSDETETDITVRVKVYEHDLFLWAVQYAEHVVVLSPESVRERVKERLKYAVQLYENK